MSVRNGCWMLGEVYDHIYVYMCVCDVVRALCSAGGDLTRSLDERSDAESVSPSEEARGYILGIAHTERDVVRVIGSVPA